jgi:hypothetical protein
MSLVVLTLRQLRQTDHLVRSLDQAATEELDGLGTIPAVSDVRTLDGDHLDD